jgi:hypothetical protein
MIEMSVIIMTPDNYATVRRVVNCLRVQTVRKQLEIVVVVPSLEDFHEDENVRADFGAWQVVVFHPILSTAQARAAGIRVATAPIIVLTEDHSFPEPTWAEAFIRAHRGTWAVVGPAVINANPDSIVSWTNFLIEYNEWLDPVSSGIAAQLPGHNSAYKRDILLQYGDRLEQLLEAESVLQWDLRAKGYQLYRESSAKTSHLNYSQFYPTFPLRFYAARLFAHTRALDWSLWHRLLYIVGSPLIPWVRLFRIVRQLRKPGRHIARLWNILPVMVWFLMIDAMGEAVGYVWGAGAAALKITDYDFHRERFLNAHDRQILKYEFAQT